MSKRINLDENNPFFLSISDLIMGVLIIFVLLYVKEISQRNPQKIASLEKENQELKIAVEEKNEIIEEIKKQLEKAKEKIFELESIITNLSLKLNESEEKVVTLEKKEATIEELHEKINQRLQEAFKDDSTIRIDTENQELILDDSVLFGVNEWLLKEAGKDMLRKILPKFFSTFTDDETVITFLEQLTIEGHTDDSGAEDAQRNYLYNLDLSQKRAYEVSKFIYSDEYLVQTMGEKRLKTLKKYLSSNGKSNANLIYKDEAKTIVDRDKSRRVTIKYRLDIQKMLKMKSNLDLTMDKNMVEDAQVKKYNEDSIVEVE